MSERRYDNVVRLVEETPWAVLPSTLQVIRAVLAERIAHVDLTDDELVERFAVQRELAAAARERANGMSKRGVAVLPLYGPIFPRANMMTEMSGATSAESFTQMLREQVRNDEVGALVIDVDSPGGMVAGVPELAAEIRAARQQKPVFAVANQLAASAAYWLMSQASEVVVAPSGEVGSIGVFSAHQDVSQLQDKLGVKTTLVSAGKYKTEASPFEPLSDEAREAMQASVDAYFEMFVEDVAKGRDVSASQVRAGYGEGRMLHASAAVEAGMADRIGTLEQTVSRALKGAAPQRAAAAGQVLFVQPASASFADVTFGGGATDGATAGTWIEAGAVLAAPADRPDVELEPDEDEKESPMEEPQDVAPLAAQPRQADPARDELFGVVHELKAAVDRMNAGTGSHEEIERLKTEVLELRELVDKNQPRNGYVPDDEAADLRIALGAEALEQVHELPLFKAARVLRRPEDDIEEFRSKADNLLFLAAATKRDPRELRYFADEYLPALAAIDTQTTGEGKEFVPTILSADLIRRVEIDLRVVNLFRQLDMPSNPYEMPGMSVARVRGGKATEQTADTGQTGFRKITPGTRKVTLNAGKFAAEVLVSKEEEEDSLIPILDFLREEVTSQLANDMEDAVINGDTAGSHMDTDTVAADDPRKIWDGLRKLAAASAKTDGSSAVIDSTKLRVNRKVMGKYGVNSSDLVHILSISSYVNLLSDPNVITVDKYGPSATIRSGELASVDGIPLIVSQYVRDDLNATGIFDNVTKTESVVITVRPSAYVVGSRRNLTVQLLTELYAEFDQDAIAVSMRKSFKELYPAATEKAVSLTYNVDA